MKKAPLSIECGTVSALICSFALFTGCSYTAMPKNVPAIMGCEMVPLRGFGFRHENSNNNLI